MNVVSSKRLYQHTSLHDVKLQKTAVWKIPDV